MEPRSRSIKQSNGLWGSSERARPLLKYEAKVVIVRGNRGKVYVVRGCRSGVRKERKSQALFSGWNLGDPIPFAGILLYLMFVLFTTSLTFFFFFTAFTHH